MPRARFAMLGKSSSSSGKRCKSVSKTLGTRPWFGQSLYLGGAHRLFDASGNLTDEESRKRVQGYVVGFAEYVGATKRRLT